MGRYCLMLCLALFICITGSGYAGETSVALEQLAGEWHVELRSNDLGAARTVFTFEVDKGQFSAYTRKGADRNILGFWKSTLARTFTRDLKKGSLLHITDGEARQAGDSLILKGIFHSAMGRYYFNGYVINEELKATLTNGRHEYRGSLSGDKRRTPHPLDDYPRIVHEALAVAQEKLYSKDLLQSGEWKEFEKHIMDSAPRLKDDVELVFAYYYYSSKLPISHFALMRIDTASQDEQDPGQKINLQLEERSPQVAILKISSFNGSAQEMDSVLKIVKEKNYPNLIVDLRSNGGGSVEAGMAFARNVVDTVLTGGIFLTRRWFNDETGPPSTDRYGEFPEFTQASYDLIIEGIHREKGLLMKVIPAGTVYRGKIYLITNGSTASTCEPIIHGLQYYGRAVVVGERTAGAMLNGERFPISSGFTVILPTADYYTIDGKRLDQQGVTPDVVLDPENAIEHVINNMIGPN